MRGCYQAGFFRERDNGAREEAQRFPGQYPGIDKQRARVPRGESEGGKADEPRRDRTQHGPQHRELVREGGYHTHETRHGCQQGVDCRQQCAGQHVADQHDILLKHFCLAAGAVFE